MMVMTNGIPGNGRKFEEHTEYYYKNIGYEVAVAYKIKTVEGRWRLMFV